MLGNPDEVQGEDDHLRDGEVLLLQLDSERWDAGMIWGDEGRLFFIIDEASLAQRDFDRARFTLSTG